MNAFEQAKEEMVRAAQWLSGQGILFRSEHANLSARVDGAIVLTRHGQVSGLDRGGFAVLSLDGELQEGELEPTNAEIVEMHTRVYRARPEVNAIVHCHAPHATAFAVANQPIPAVYEPLLRFGHADPTPVVPWAPRGSRESVDGIVERVEGRPTLWAALLANHGALAFGTAPMPAAQLMATLDEAAELVIAARQLGGETPLPDAAFAEVRARMGRFGVSGRPRNTM